MDYLELSLDNDIPHDHMIHILYPYPLNVVSLYYIFRSVSELSMFYIHYVLTPSYSSIHHACSAVPSPIVVIQLLVYVFMLSSHTTGLRPNLIPQLEVSA